MAEAKIQVLSGPQAGEEKVFQDSIILGRSHTAGLVLHHATVSREHARIFHRGGVWNVVDLKSRNGTRLKGKPVTKAEIRNGDELTLGEVKIRFLEAGGKALPEEKGESERESGQDQGSPPGAGEEITFGGEEIHLEGGEGAEKAAPPERGAPAGPPGPPGPAGSQAPPPSARPAVPKAGPSPVGRPAGRAVRRLGEGRVDLPVRPGSKEGKAGLLEEDLSQWSGFAKFLAVLAGLALGALLFYLAFTMVS